jgi:hypothetical protein
MAQDRQQLDANSTVPCRDLPPLSGGCLDCGTEKQHATKRSSFAPIQFCLPAANQEEISRSLYADRISSMIAIFVSEDSDGQAATTRAKSESKGPGMSSPPGCLTESESGPTASDSAGRAKSVTTQLRTATVSNPSHLLILSSLELTGATLFNAARNRRRGCGSAQQLQIRRVVGDLIDEMAISEPV